MQPSSEIYVAYVCSVRMELTKLHRPSHYESGCKTEFGVGENRGFWVWLTPENITPSYKRHHSIFSMIG